jgi:hypothetical protein
MDDHKFPPSRLELIQKWHELATTDPAIQDNAFFKFVATWVAFNAFYAEMFLEKENDTKQIEKYSDLPETKKIHSALLKDQQYKAAVLFFRMQGVRDVAKPRDLFDTQTIFKQVYKVRCNLFHGGKLPKNPRDYSLVENAYKIVSNVVNIELRKLIKSES